MFHRGANLNDKVAGNRCGILFSEVFMDVAINLVDEEFL